MNKASELGQSMIMFTLALTALIGFASATIDVGRYMMARQERQNAADAAALAGASELPASPSNAISLARNYVLTNGLKDSDIKSITVTSKTATNDTINVQLKSNFDWGLAAVLGLFQGQVVADSAAKVSSPSAMGNLQPWGVVESAINWNGSPTVLKYDSNNSQTGNFGSLALDGTGASTYEDTIKYGSNATLCPFAQVGCTHGLATTESGNMIGSTRTGVAYLISNTSTACDTFAEVFQTRPDGSYAFHGRCNPWNGATDSKRVVLVPVVGSLCNGRCDLQVKYFAVFFLNSLDSCSGNNCQVTGQFARVLTNFSSEDLGGVYDNYSLRHVRLTS